MEVGSAWVRLALGEERGEYLPAALASTVLLGLLGVGVGVAGLGEVAGEMLGGVGGTIGEAGVVTVVELVRLAHWQEG